MEEGAGTTRCVVKAGAQVTGPPEGAGAWGTSGVSSRVRQQGHWAVTHVRFKEQPLRPKVGNVGPSCSQGVRR